MRSENHLVVYELYDYVLNKSALNLIDEVIKDNDADAFMQHKEGRNVNNQYLTGFKPSDSFTYLRYNEESILLVPPVEKIRARRESNADVVRQTTEFAPGDVRDDIGLEAEVISDFVKSYGIDKLCTPRDFKLYLSKVLTKNGLTVETTKDVVMEARKQKSRDEVEKLTKAQKATEKSMEHAKSILQGSDSVEGTLQYEGKILTSERVKKKIREFLRGYNCYLDEVIVASGSECSDPHNSGSGPIDSNKPIIIDIFPQHESGYWGDMTRTFVKGTPSKEFQSAYRTTREAFKQALNVLSRGAGVTGSEVHNTVCDVFESSGYNTVRQGDFNEGFLHSTGHSIGLEAHEPPRIVSGCGKLRKGNVLTIEPGLYSPDYGGTRIEDMVVVTENGYKNINSLQLDYRI